MYLWGIDMAETVWVLTLRQDGSESGRVEAVFGAQGPALKALANVKSAGYVESFISEMKTNEMQSFEVTNHDQY